MEQMEQHNSDILLKAHELEKELLKRGYVCGWHKPIHHVGSIYILVNPSFPKVVKIGYADDLEKRVRGLSGTNVPTPFHCYAAYKVTSRLTDKDVHKMIDVLNPGLRYDSGREFYTMSKEQAYTILYEIAKISGTMDALVKNPLNDSYFGVEPCEDSDSHNEEESHIQKRPPVNFLECGLKIGDMGVCVKDQSIVVYVADGRNVTCRGEIMSLARVISKYLPKYSAWAATPLFAFNGENLCDIALRTQWKNVPQGSYAKGQKPVMESASSVQTKKRTFTFEFYGIRPGEKLTFNNRDGHVSEVEVVDEDSKVRYNGKTYENLSVLGKAVTGNPDFKWPADYFRYRGKTLRTIRDEMTDEH